MKKTRTTVINELVPLADRLRYLQLIRLLLVGSVLAYLVMVPEARLVPAMEVAAVVIGYVAMVVVGQGLWHVARRGNVTLFGALLIGDGFFLAWIGWATGGPSSALRHLVLVHLVTVALLASYRTAVKIALWHSLLALCLLHAGRAGLLSDAGADVLAGNDMEQLAAFLGLAWAAVLTTAAFAAVNERELRRRKVDLEDLARLASALEQAGSPTDVAKGLRAALVDAYGFANVVVLTVDGSELVPVGPGPSGPAATRLSLEQPHPVVDAAWRSRVTQLVPRLDVGADPLLRTLFGASRNLLVTPLFAEGHAIGLVIAEHGLRQGSRIERRVVTMTERFCGHAALALRNASLVEELRAMAATDGLTKVANRRTFESALTRELARSGRTGDPTSVVMVDIDHFKSLNDRFGHQTGDEVLKAVAASLTAGCRAADLVARYGGEEFVLVLHSCPTDAAVDTAERLRRDLALVDTGTEAVVTASFGVATFPFDGTDPETLMSAADGALYRAKREGRDRVVVASEDAHHH